ncbi:Gfo/Idh/MocA family oxidoreductase [Aliifodinibius sp. S!AR15-10]|uniref:Gfo/Idh/MocA family protein n=1 Tax=Aliifodinibius sp. S!AR15-10 TaxID=2950437 RepID=UPI0028587864|nr:Gfo/Idh/MocA family oxidoreductase [Aliifodinibius sp. S!AR15-10]MDR8391733.1 Gfo/Idh/MocA family oxidoreductase [Aliifodinibius sp. S!AR15-10]
MNSQKDKNRNSISRRDFCKTTAFAAGAGMLFGSLPVGASAYAGASDTLKLALIGCGGRGSGAARQALTADKGIKLVAMADVFRDRLDGSLQRLNERFGSDQIDVPEEHKFIGFEGYKNAISVADVVILATPAGFRPLHFEEAINAGKHVFMEKPLATDAPGIRKVLEVGELAKQKNLNVVVGLQRHYQNSYRKVSRHINDGAVGKIVSGQVYWNIGAHWVRERNQLQTELEYQMRNWYYFTWLSGDHILEQHIHNIDVANWFIGEYPISAQGMGGREVRVGPQHGEIFDHHFVEFTYPGGAVIASQCRNQEGTMGRVGEMFQATKGTVETDNNSNGMIKIWDGKVLLDYRGDQDISPYQQENNELFASIRKGDVINNTEYGAKSTMAAILGRMATYSGKQVTWDEAIKSNRKLFEPEGFGWNSPPPVVLDRSGNYPSARPGVTEVL